MHKPLTEDSFYTRHVNQKDMEIAQMLQMTKWVR
jgi:hypothetical protein